MSLEINPNSQENTHVESNTKMELTDNITDEEKNKIVIVSDPSQNEDQSDEPPLSKRQRKKLLRVQNWETKKQEKRQKEKEKKRLKKQEIQEKGIVVENKGPSRKVLKKLKSERVPANFKVAIDLDFDDLMIDKDICKAVKQILRIYTTNRRATNPIPLYLCGIKENGKIQKCIERNDGYQHWDLVRTIEKVDDIFKDKEKLIYLSAESDNVVETFEKDHIYVIGGLVDHNNHKGLCFNKANELGIKTARLPLSEHIVIKTRTVLTINQVFEIILRVSESKEWQKTLLDVIPKRKDAKPLEKVEDE